MKGFKKTVGLLLCICMLAGMGMSVAAEEVLDFSEWADGTTVTEVTPDSGADYAPPSGYKGSYYKIAADSGSVYTPYVGTLEEGKEYTFGFRYKTGDEKSGRAIRIYLYHVNNAEIGGAPKEVGSYIQVSPAPTDGVWTAYETTVAVPTYSEDAENGIYKAGSHVAIRVNFRNGEAEMQVADIHLNTNKVQNSNFEAYNAESLTTAPTNWVFSSGTGGEKDGSVSSDPEAFKTVKTVAVENGNAFVKFVPALTAANRMPFVRQQIDNLKPETQYRLSFKFRTTAVTEGHAAPCLKFIHHYIPTGETAEIKTAVEYTPVNFKYAPVYTGGTDTYYVKATGKLEDAPAGDWTNYTISFITPASTGDNATLLYLQGDGTGKNAEGTYAEFCYDDVILEEDYTEVKLYDTDGKSLTALEPGKDAVVKLHYVPKTVRKTNMDVILAAYTKGGTVKSLKDVDIVSQAPAGALTFDGDTQPTVSCIMPQDYELSISVPEVGAGETVSVTALCFDSIANMAAGEKLIIPVQ